MKTSQLTRLFLLLGALAFAVVGQFYFARKPDFVVDGVVFYVVAVILFFAALRRPGVPAAPRSARTTPRPPLWRIILVALGLLLVLLVVAQLTEPQDNYWPLFWLWIVGSLCYLAGFARRLEVSWRDQPGRPLVAARAWWARRGKTSAQVAASGAAAAVPVTITIQSEPAADSAGLPSGGTDEASGDAPSALTLAAASSDMPIDAVTVLPASVAPPTPPDLADLNQAPIPAVGLPAAAAGSPAMIDYSGGTAVPMQAVGSPTPASAPAPAPATAVAILEISPVPAAHAAPARGTTGGARASAASSEATSALEASAEAWEAWPVWLEWTLVALLVAAALALRAWRIDSIPWTVAGDEGNFGLWARSVLSGQLKNMFATGHLSMPTMYTFFQAAWLRLAGDNVVGLRLPWAVLGAFSVLGAYLLVRRLFGPWLALLTGVFLATYHFHIHYSRLGLNNISDPLFISWALYFLVLAWQRPAQGGRRWAWAACGMVCGLAFYPYTGSRLVPVVVVAVLAWTALVDRRFLRGRGADLLALLGGFLVVFGPMGIFALQHPDDFNARINQISIFQSGWLDAAVRATGQSRLSLLFDQVQRAFLAFNFYLDRTDFYHPLIPLLDFAASIFFVFGLALAGVRSLTRSDDPDVARRVRYAIFVIWFVLAVLLGGALTESPPSSQRLVATTVPVAFFVALALHALTVVLRDTLSWTETMCKGLAFALLAVLAFTGLRYYFVTYQQDWIYGSYNGEVSTRIGYYLRDLADHAPEAPAAPAEGGPAPRLVEYFLGAPRMYADFGSVPFIAKGVDLRDLAEPLTAPPNLAGPTVRPVFIFLPERRGELTFVQQAFPNGTAEEIHREDNPAEPLLFVAYRVN